MKKVFVFLLIVLLSGCAVRTIYIANGKAVRLRQAVPEVKVWVIDKDGTPVATEMTIPEGWYALPYSEDK